MDMDKNNVPDYPPRKKAKTKAESDPSKMDLATLPYDILLHIFKYLDMKSISNCATLCSTLNNISKDNSLYTRVEVKYNMNPEFLKSYIARISFPVKLTVEYNPHATETEDCRNFNDSVIHLLKKCGDYLKTLCIESCKTEEVLAHLSECTNLKVLYLYRCRSTFASLMELNTIVDLKFTSCHFPQKTVGEIIKKKTLLKNVSLIDNVNVNVNEVCEIMSRYNPLIRKLYLSERKKLKAKSVRALARLIHLKSLELVSGTGFDCDPEDSLEQLAAGCPNLERLGIYGWKEINDDNLIPALRLFLKLRVLDLRGTNITIKSCREAALTLPYLECIDVFKSHRIKKAQLVQLQKDFSEIEIAL